MIEIDDRDIVRDGKCWNIRRLEYIPKCFSDLNVNISGRVMILINHGGGKFTPWHLPKSIHDSRDSR